MTLGLLKEQIAKSKYKVISFDIFDTLLVRPCLQPTDLLKLVGLRCSYRGNYLEMRRIAEKNARRTAAADEITYEDIYRQMRVLFDIPDCVVEEFKQTELQVERQYLYARQAMKEVYDFTRKIGKKIIIVSDMYLPKKFLEEILVKNGYEGFDKLFLSSEYGVMKSSGKLYDCILAELEQEGIGASDILHMGDNEKSDVLIPRGKGIHCVHIPRTTWLLRKNKKLNLLYDNIERTLDNSFLVGFSANLVFNDPFRLYSPNSYFYGSRYSAANMLFAPLFFSFVKWMLEDCINNNIQTLCMVYRDGYIPEKIYECLRPYYEGAPEIRRLYLTRAMINRFNCDKDNPIFESINEMLYNDRMSVGEFIRNRLLVEDDAQYQLVLDIFKKHGYKNEDSKVGRRDELSIWLKEINSIFVQNAGKSVDTIKDYCRDTLAKSGKLAVYDVGYRGRVCTFLKEQMGIESVGYHLYAKDNVRVNNVNIKYGVMYGLLSEKETMIINPLTEDLLNSREASVIDVKRDEEGNYCLIRDSVFPPNKCIENLQDYIIQYAEKISDLFQDDLKLLNFDISNYFEFYKIFLTAPVSVDTKIIRDANVDDSSFMNPRAKDKYKEWNLKYRFRSKTDRILYEMTSSIWNASLLKIKYRLKPTVMFVGNPKFINSDTINQLSIVAKKNNENDYHLLMETTEHFQYEYEDKLGFNVDIISKIDLPRGYDEGVDIKLPDTIKTTLAQKQYLQSSVNEVKSKLAHLGDGYAEALVHYWFCYFRKMIWLYNQPNAKLSFVVWDDKSPMHTLLCDMCKEYGIDISFVKDSSIVKSSADIAESHTQGKDTLSRDRKMRIAICASMPKKGYSGGRTHALNLAECLAYKGNEVFFISRFLPMFVDEMKASSGHNNIHFICQDDLSNDEAFEKKFTEQYLDYLVVVPHRNKDDAHYLMARRVAKRMNAKLVLLNYETPNWVNKYLKQQQDYDDWRQWRSVTDDGCLVLCSDKESVKYAKEFYLDNPSHTIFDYWYPVINSLVADQVVEKKENKIIAFVRPGDINKGTNDVLRILELGVNDYEVVLICGRGIHDVEFYDFMRRINSLKTEFGIKCSLKMQPTDYEKFVEISKAKYMLFPSLFEGYGTPPIEAQYCNTVCFVYDLPVLRETCKDGVIYCEYGNAEDMHSKLIDCINRNYQRNDLREKIYENANFECCSSRLDAMFRAHLDEEWRFNKN